MDVSAKQRLFYHVVFLPLTRVLAVLPYVISSVMPLLFEIERRFVCKENPIVLSYVQNT
jgi:hypothetical protein